MRFITFIIRHVKIFALQVSLSFGRETSYRSNFSLLALTDLIWILVEFFCFEAIYSHTPQIAGWTKAQVYFFLGIFFATDAVFTTFFARNFWYFGDLILKGDLDTLLLKPVNTVFLAVTRRQNIADVFNIFFGLIIAFYYSSAAGFEGGWHWITVPLWMSIGVYAAILTRFLSSVVIFWFEKPYAFSGIYYRLFTFSTKPDALYPRILRKILSTVLPFALIASIPARALLHGLSLDEYATIAAVLMGYTALNTFLWNAGLKKYSSASS